MVVNKFTDWTEEEFKAILGYKPAFKAAVNPDTIDELPVVGLPD